MCKTKLHEKPRLTIQADMKNEKRKISMANKETLCFRG